MAGEHLNIPFNVCNACRSLLDQIPGLFRRLRRPLFFFIYLPEQELAKLVRIIVTRDMNNLLSVLSLSIR